MLTAAQCAVAAYETEDGELFCMSCFEQGDTFARPVIQYGLDERQQFESAIETGEDPEEFWGEPGHSEYCMRPVLCAACGEELVEAWHENHGEVAS